MGLGNDVFSLGKEERWRKAGGRLLNAEYKARTCLKAKDALGSRLPRSISSFWWPLGFGFLPVSCPLRPVTGN